MRPTISSRLHSTDLEDPRQELADVWEGAAVIDTWGLLVQPQGMPEHSLEELEADLLSGMGNQPV